MALGMTSWDLFRDIVESFHQSRSKPGIRENIYKIWLNLAMFIFTVLIGLVLCLVTCNRKHLSFCKIKLLSKQITHMYSFTPLSFSWLGESQKICKIVMRKFTIFSSGLIFKETFFKSSISFLLSIL